MGFLNKQIRLWAGIAAVSLLFSFFPAPVYAREAEDGQTILTTTVKGQPDTVENGSGEVKLSDGRTVTAEGKSLPDGLLLVVESADLSDTDTYGWITECMKGLGTNLSAYDIYFVDTAGQRYEVTEDITITISLNGGYQSPAIYSVSRENGASRLESSVRDDRISFKTAYGGYYVLAEQKKDSAGGDSGSGSSSEKDGSHSGTGAENTGSGAAVQQSGAQTGDQTNAAIWILLFAASAAGITGIIVRRKHIFY